MEHYVSEMQCDICGRVRCICPPAAEPERFAFDVNFDIVAASSLGMRRFFIPIFDTPAAALQARATHIERPIAAWEQDHAQRMAGLRAALARAPKAPTVAKHGH